MSGFVVGLPRYSRPKRVPRSYAHPTDVVNNYIITINPNRRPNPLIPNHSQILQARLDTVVASWLGSRESVVSCFDTTPDWVLPPHTSMRQHVWDSIQWGKAEGEIDVDTWPKMDYSIEVANDSPSGGAPHAHITLQVLHNSRLWFNIATLKAILLPLYNALLLAGESAATGMYINVRSRGDFANALAYIRKQRVPLPDVI